VARNGRPVARLVALEPAEVPRRGGRARGEITSGPAFDDPLPDDVQAAFEGRA
jgi:antitoxin (DNA-binding transcriptional repressor) of toxin-antitoxin stability system